MNKILFLIIIFLFVNNVFAHKIEGILSVISPNGEPVVKTVRLYQLSDLVNPFRQAESYSFFQWSSVTPDANFGFDTIDSWDDNAQWTYTRTNPLEKEVPPGTYRLRIDNKYVILTITQAGCRDFHLIFQNNEFEVDFIKLPDRVQISETMDWDIPIIVENYVSETEIGGVELDAEYYNTGSTVNIINSIPHDFYAPDEYTGHNFRNWNDLFDYPYERLNLDNQFPDEAAGLTFSSHYEPTLPLTVTNNLEGGNGGTYKVTWDKKPNEHFTINSGTDYNAFEYQATLDDRYIIEAYNQNALGADWYFQSWNTGSTNNAISGLQVTDTTSFTANYKGHFRSNQQDGFSSNSQRKVVRDDNGIYHMVYKSLGKIWYTKSTTTNFTGSWEPEIDLTDGGDEILRNPSITYFDDTLVVAFEYRENPGDQTPSIYIAAGDVDDATPLNTLFFIEDYSLSNFGSALPVVTFSYKQADDVKIILIVYKPNSISNLRYARNYLYDTNHHIWTESNDGLNDGDNWLVYDLSGTWSASSNPLIISILFLIS